MNIQRKNLIEGRNIYASVMEETGIELGNPKDYTTTELFNIFHDEYKDLIPEEDGHWDAVFRKISGVSKKATDACYMRNVEIPNDPKVNEKLVDYLERLNLKLDDADGVALDFVQQVEDIAESVGWYVTGSDPDSTDWTFYVGNPDFEVDYTIEVDAANAEELIQEVENFVDTFDISEETYLWLDQSGHGTHGAPYDMRDCYEDIERFYKQAEILAKALRKGLR